ncbi:hypothetical protein BUALT_Bualt15G0083500 [Buddleja alternifolia]|uniref:Aminomethyltransferase folate-binding domain-containing protein n=1 Tax=Buddleja alternifolia TaxID=168488 RepID=A0AAV6WLC5_9LAMI|nr:hypothetical protein BUALT_Bualt15G0083500 [Buddleja alternifolia]
MFSLPAATSSRTCSLRRSLHAPPYHSLRHGEFRFHQKKKKKQYFFSLACALPFDLSPPPIDLDDPLETTAVAEAEVLEDGAENTCDDDDSLDAVDNGVAVVDLSDYGRIRVSGEDRIQFLHNQTTANFECLGEGQGCDTVFVTPTARTIDIAHAWIMKNAIMLVVSSMKRGSITEMLKKYIFFADKVEIQDITDQTSMFALLGPKSIKIMEELNLGDLVGLPYGSHKHYSVGGMPLTVAVGSIIAVEGFTFMMSPDAAKTVWKALRGQGAVPMGPSAWETLRILRGRPAPDKELTDEFNVLEAGLWRAVSLDKGCYKGQETISRLVTYDGIKQKLWGIYLSSPVEPGSVITADGKKVGKLTSFTAGTKSSKPFGLGYIKRRTASEGDSVTVGDSVVGTLVEVPFLREQLPPSKG